ncbi:hypothetical protein KY358_06455 [Candidatus Woesearchaeota archaeon]|nr:hypothetical protein [Candidatus Woesearchaeota archaeon]
MLVQSFSGVRGVYGKDLTDETALIYGYTFNRFLKEKLNKEPLIVIGYDTRPSSETLRDSVSRPFSDIIDVGIAPVAALELAVREFGADGGVMITASHNEPEYNGFKFLDKDGAVLRPDDMARAISMFKKNFRDKERIINAVMQDEAGLKAKNIQDKNKEAISRYSIFLKGLIGNIRGGRRIIIDVNGGSGICLKGILDTMGIRNIILVNSDKGKFIRRIEPDRESLKGLKKLIEKEGAEFAVGLDCDADRAEILLRDGTLIDGNYLLALIEDDILKKKKGTVVVNDATSGIIREIAEKHGSDVREVEVGEINVVDEMLKLNSPVAGEGSNGGVIIPPSRCRDGILSSLYLLKIIEEKGKPLSSIIKELPAYFSIQKKVKLNSPSDYKRMRPAIKAYYMKKGKRIRETGGITGGLKAIIDDKSFVWFRASKTEPCLLRVIADSCSEKGSERLIKEAFSLVKEIDL